MTRYPLPGAQNDVPLAEHDLERIIADAAEAFLRLSHALQVMKAAWRREISADVSEWLSLRQVAGMLAVGYTTVWHLARRGDLPSTLVPSARGTRAIRRISRAQLDRYLSGRISPTPQREPDGQLRGQTMA